MQTVASVTEVPLGSLASQLSAAMASLYASPAPTVANHLSRWGRGIACLTCPGTPVLGPVAAVPDATQFGAGVDSAAGGGSGFFFDGVVAVLALAALFVPRVVCALRMFGRSLAPAPFVCLLERPG